MPIKDPSKAERAAALRAAKRTALEARALRSNLLKRKAQARARPDTAATPPEGSR